MKNMIKEFLKEQNIHLENIWVCHDLSGNIRSFVSIKTNS